MSSTPTIGVVIATPGRRSLLRTLNSIAYQGLIPGDDVLVVGDGFDPATKALVEACGHRYEATRRTRDWGHSQQNYGLKHVRGDWLLLQDDDDIFLPRAFDEAREIISKLEFPRPVVGRVVTPFLGILWKAPKQEPLDGHCLLVPNDKEKLGYFTSDYSGDQTWLQTNMLAYDTVSWADRVWSLTRPTWTLWPTRIVPIDGWDVSWAFSKSTDGVFVDEGDPPVVLGMWRRGDDWHGQVATLNTLTSFSVEEFTEVLEFAAWAGQGCDVLFRIPVTHIPLTIAAKAAGYKEHAREDDTVEYVSNWPPAVKVKE